MIYFTEKGKENAIMIVTGISPIRDWDRKHDMGTGMFMPIQLHIKRLS